MKSEERCSCNIRSAYNARLLRVWSDTTQTPFSTLGANLLERGLENAIAQGIVPAPVINQVNNEFFTPIQENNQ